ncbi:MAG: WecB/TagA/CpsF family glycosyltransferase [Spirochaetaceae bacterium]|nr:WecB/TagA/CpsF family glycosyltransferase [Spirochaetaceae bacterium]
MDGLEKIELLKVPLTIAPAEKMEEIVYALLSAGRGKDIVLLSVWDLLRARRNGEYRNFVVNAGLVIPISKSLVHGAKFLKKTLPVRYMPFDFIVNLLTILEKREQPVYLLGGKPAILLKTEKNITQTFPRLRVIGRCPGYFKKHNEDVIITMIRKSTPALLLVGQGVHGRERWVAHNGGRLNPGLRLWCSDIFEVFAERKKRPSRRVFQLGLEWIGYCFQKPVRFFRIFLYLYYNVLLLGTRLSKNSNERT